MPDNGAVYQPTTVGYSYDTGVDGFLGVGSVTRHKLGLRKWLEWVSLSTAVPLTAAGLIFIIVALASGDSINAQTEPQQYLPTKPIEVQQIPVAADTNSTKECPPSVNRNRYSGDDSNGRTIAIGATLLAFGFLLGLIWVWLRFYKKRESPRNEPSGGGGQMLGGLNPSTDLLVGSPSQYGPVLTEVPSHPKTKQITNHQNAASALSDQEEETRTLMQEPPTFSPNSNNTSENQHPE
ncbi:uncharacterized protein LOC124412010 [Diprion similis]|uniref:uncharacterized protein LOC124412010 n=1 Tax=Diprion similis TaxID=362088 RepID=UPI001EF97E62|nr:uncharacterized protein LOC124412010 [Diprion similis]XP_046747614.1 uncharacterized protein LOC124412010 [Diprion similis]XP_046747616.1 uncharacterized protein LOC124412010 [Diprion similis]